MENVGGFMDKYILKFLGAAVSLNLFSIGIANSMMSTNEKMVCDFTGEKILLGDVDNIEVLSDGTMLVYVPQKSIKNDLEKYKKIIKNLKKYRSIRNAKDVMTSLTGVAGTIIGLTGMAISDLTDSKIPLYLGIVFGWAPGGYAGFKSSYRVLSGSMDYENDETWNTHVYIGYSVLEENLEHYPDGIILMKRPELKDKQYGIHHSNAFQAKGFDKNVLIKEIARGY